MDDALELRIAGALTGIVLIASYIIHFKLFAAEVRALVEWMRLPFEAQG